MPPKDASPHLSFDLPSLLIKLNIHKHYIQQLPHQILFQNLKKLKKI